MGTAVTNPESMEGTRSARTPEPIKTYSLEEVAAMVLPPDMKDAARWLRRRLLSGEIPGYKIGRTWRMTREDVEDFIRDRRNTPRPREVSNQDGDDDPRVVGKPPGLTRRSWIIRQNRRTR